MNKCCATVVLGGGGHTKEMLEILKTAPEPWGQLNLVYSTGDNHSLEMFKQEINCGFIRAFQVPKPNEVLGGYSAIRMIYSLLVCLYISFFVRGAVVLCNGPGICVPFCLSHKLLHPFTPVVYVESVTRRHTLSLTGRVLQYVVDLFVVQSKALARPTFPKRKYCDIFVFPGCRSEPGASTPARPLTPQ